MQDHGDPPVRPGRPSLLSSQPQAEPERQRILSSLDGVARPAAAVAPVRRKGRGAAWAGIGVAGAAIAAAVVFFVADEARDAAPVRVAALPAPHAAAPVTLPDSAPAADAVPAPEATQAPEARAATVRDTPEAPDTPDTRDIPGAGGAAHANPLADMAPAAPSPARHKDPLTRTLEKPARQAHAQKTREHKAEQAKLAQKKAREKERTKRAAGEPDSDVLLLSALMAHMQPKDRKATPAQQLDSCKRYNAAGEEQCRARVCLSSGATEPACAGVAAKAAPGR